MSLTSEPLVTLCTALIPGGMGDPRFLRRVREADPARLHRTSVIINGAQMIAVLPAFVGLVG